MKKKGWLFLLPALALAALLALFFRAQEAETPQALTGELAALSLRVTDGTGQTQELSCWQNENGEGFFFLPSHASLEAAELLVNGESTTEPPLDLSAVTPGEALSVTDGGRETTLTFLCSEALPAVYITTASGSLEAVQADKSYKESGDIRVVNADGTVEYAGQLKYIKGRGNTTWDYEKKPYNIKLTEKADLFGMGASKDWCLLANYRDESYVRNAMVFDYAREMGVANTTETQSFDLYVNGEYQGLYQLTEKVEIGENRLELPDLEELNELKNPQKGLDEFPTFDYGNAKGVSLPATPAERDGFLMELDFPERWAEEVSGFVTAQGQHVVLKSPENASEEQVEYARALVQEFEDRLLAGDEGYLDCIDLDSWAQLYLIEEIFEDVDCGLSSIYFYIQDGKLYAGPLWDFDLTMGASYAVTNPRTLYAAWPERTERYTSYFLPELYRQESFRARVTELYADGWDEALTALAARAEDYVAAVAAGARMDAVRWGKDYEATLAQGAYLRDYLTQRQDFLTSLWVEGVRYQRVRLMGNVYTRYYEYAVETGDTFDDFPALYKEGYTLEGWYYEGTDEPFDPSAPITEDTYLYAKWTAD
ncbi:MAG: CotH kinase family protein [Oscillospiraceae bacterium]